MSTSLRILKRDALLSYLATSRTALWRLIRDDLFPPGFPINGNQVGWLEREAEQYARLVASDATDAQVRAWVRRVIEARRKLNPVAHQ